MWPPQELFRLLTLYALRIQVDYQVIYFPVMPPGFNILQVLMIDNMWRSFQSSLVYIVSSVACLISKVPLVVQHTETLRRDPPRGELITDKKANEVWECFASSCPTGPLRTCVKGRPDTVTGEWRREASMLMTACPLVVLKGLEIWPPVRAQHDGCHSEVRRWLHLCPYPAEKKTWDVPGSVAPPCCQAVCGGVW